MGCFTTALILGLCVQHAWSASSSSTTTAKPPVKAEKRQSFEQYYVQQDTPGQQFLTIQQQQSPQAQQPQQYFRPSPQVTPNQLSPEYVRLLQQIENEQVYQNQQADSNAQQIYDRGPQLFVGSSQRPPQRPQLTPEQQAQRQLQESIAQRGLREQEVRDAQRLQQAAQYQAYQQPEAPFQPSLPPPQPFQQYARPTPVPTPQAQPYGRPQPQIQYAPTFRVPERVSYSQVQFGTTNLQRQSRLIAPKPLPQQQIIYSTAVPTQQQQSHQQQLYRQETIFDDAASSTQPRPTPYQADTTEPQKSTQQYLVETSNLDQPDQTLLTVPKSHGQSGQVYYTTSSQQPHQTAYQIQAEPQQGLYINQQQQQYDATPPPRSAIFVSSARVPAYRNEAVKSEGRPLTQGELKALIDAGFRVSPLQEPSYGRLYDGRELSKRQNSRLVPRPVPLSPSERREYERHGIRNVYRVEPVENQEAPSAVRYVLAIGPPMG